MGVRYRPAATAEWYREQYAKHGCQKIAKLLGVSRHKVLKDLHRLGIQVRPQSPHRDVKRDYFERIETPAKAYVFGFIMADGNVIRSGGQLRIRIAQRDRLHLEALRLELGGPPLRTEAPQRGRQQRQLVLCVSAKQIVEALIRHGATENKDNVLGPVALFEHPLDRHFVRGLVDGDGTLKHVKGKFPRIEFKNRNGHLRAAVRRYWESLGATVREYSWRGKYPVIYCGSRDSVTVARAMYLSDADLALPFKLDRARDFQRYRPRSAKTERSQV